MKKKQIVVFAIVAMALTGVNVKTAMTANLFHGVAINSFSAMGEVGGEIGGESGGEIGGENAGWGGSSNCIHGGPGSKSCSIDEGITVGPGGASKGCSVECYDGYYACCGATCRCIPIG